METLKERPITVYAKRLGSVWHIRTRFHTSWYVALVLIIWVLVTQLPEDNPLWQRIIFGVGGSLLFFIVVNMRQVIINIVTALIGIPVRNVSLFVSGGVTQVPRGATRPLYELIVALTGLLLNVLIAGIFQWQSLKESMAGDLTTAVIIQWMAFFWYMIASIHLLPGLPLEDGRILMVILWKTTKNYVRAVRISAGIGRGLGLLFILGGIALVVTRSETVNGLYLAFFGWVLQSAAGQVYRRTMLLDALKDANARDVMTREYPAVSPELNLEQLVNNYALVTGHDYYAVTESRKLLGVITISSIKHVSKKKWCSTTVGEIMTPAKKVKTIQAEQAAAYVIEQMDQFKIDEVPVILDDELIGVAVRDRLVSLARIRAELRI